MVAKQINVMFLCGSLEPGRDGVGDYTRRLAGELLRQGHKAAIISLNDPFCTSPDFGTQLDDEVSIEVYRLPTSLSSKERFKLAKQWVFKMDPVWLSLQFVPYSFSVKGIPFGLASNLKGMGAKRKWHIMIHELWIGIYKESSSKEWAIGNLQRVIVKNLISTLAPAKLQTQTKLYQNLIGQLGYRAGYLPLFSNIPLLYSKNVQNQQRAKKSKELKFVIFGGIFKDAPIEVFCTELKKYSILNEIIPTLTILGRCGEEQYRWADTWKLFDLKVDVLGEQEPMVISKTLSECDIALTTTPVPLLEKSGTAAAMSIHGLPIISVSRPWTPRLKEQLRPQKGVFKFIPGNLDICIKGCKDQTLKSYSAQEVGSMLLNDLKITE